MGMGLFSIKKKHTTCLAGDRVCLPAPASFFLQPPTELGHHDNIPYPLRMSNGNLEKEKCILD